jgi:hypothetical protein
VVELDSVRLATDLLAPTLAFGIHVVNPPDATVWHLFPYASGHEYLPLMT